MLTGFEFSICKLYLKKKPFLYIQLCEFFMLKNLNTEIQSRKCKVCMKIWSYYSAGERGHDRSQISYVNQRWEMGTSGGVEWHCQLSPWFNEIKKKKIMSLNKVTRMIPYQPPNRISTNSENIANSYCRAECTSLHKFQFSYMAQIGVFPKISNKSGWILQFIQTDIKMS